MKILHIVPSYKPAYVYGGPIESVAKLCEAQAALGNHVQVFTTTANGKVELDVTKGVNIIVEGVNVVYFKRLTNDPTHISPRLWAKLFKEVKKFDVVHIHSWWNPLVMFSAAICHLNKVPVVVSPRGMLSEYIFNNSNRIFKSLLHSSVGKSILSRARFHATSNSEYISCEKLIPQWQGFILPNIISLPGKIWCKKINYNSLKILFLSRIHPKKGLELLFSALAEVSFSFTLDIAGDGDQLYIDELKRLAVSLKIEPQINWLGWMGRENKFNLLSQADVFVLTSFNENFANVVVESIFVGTPVLISDEVGLADFVKETGTGWICRLNRDEIKAALQRVFLDARVKQHTADNGQNIVNNYFSSEVVVPHYILEYQNTIRLSHQKKMKR